MRYLHIVDPFQYLEYKTETFKKEIARLERIGVLEKCSDSPWASPTFIIPKSDGTVRSVSDFRKVNAQLVRKPFPIPKISDIMQQLEGFSYASTLDLNMGYYTIRLDARSQDVCTIITPWGKYKYLRLPMGVMCAPDIFQDRMYDLMAEIECARTYLDDLLVLSRGSFNEHLIDLEKVLKRLSEANLRVNIRKCDFAASEISYLGYILTRDGIKPHPKKIEAIMNLAQPTTRKDVRRLLGMVQYYRDLWQHRSHILGPLTDAVGGSTDKKKNSMDCRMRASE